MNIQVCKYTELQQNIGKKLYLIHDDKNLYMGILTRVTTENTKYNILNIKLKFADKREYVTNNTSAEYLVL